MFRDLKEYQEIAKIYADKVSKPEDLEENQANRMKMKATRDANRPKTRAEVGLPPKKQNFDKRREARGSSYRGKPEPKPMPTTAEIRAKDKAAGGTGMSNIPKAEGNAVIDGKKLNPNFGKKSEIKPEISKFTKQGKPRTKAQMMAAKRIGSGTAKNPDTTIAQVKQSNQDSMRARAKAKFAAFKAKREEKRVDKQRDFDDPDKKMNRGESYIPDAYDVVLEYLLSTEQAATIEEANYIMTEMDAKTIQDIVS